MSQARKDTRSAAENARDTRASLAARSTTAMCLARRRRAERAARGEITSEEAVRIFSDRALNQDMKKIDIAAIEAARRGPARPGGQR